MGEELNIDYKALRDRAYNWRYNLFENLETHLLGLESNLVNHEVTVRWAQDENNLCDEIVNLLPNQMYNTVCFDMDHVPEELLNRGNVLSVCELERVANHEQDVETLVVSADFAISGTGELVFVNRKSKDCFNKISNLIVVVNIDRIIASQEELSLFLYLRNYVKNNASTDDLRFISKPFDKIIADMFQSSNSQGYTKEKVTVKTIFYENNITAILQNNRLRDALFCINCGKCIEVCPVAKTSGGVSPIELVKNSCTDLSSRSQNVFQKTTLCGNCKESCPVGINFTDLLIHVMHLINDKTNYGKNKRLFSALFKRSKMNKYNSTLFRYFFVNRFYGKNKTLANYFSSIKGPFFNIAEKDPQDNLNE